MQTIHTKFIWVKMPTKQILEHLRFKGEHYATYKLINGYIYRKRTAVIKRE